MNYNIKKLLERQDCWQKNRKAESWVEKLAKSAATRKTLVAFSGRELNYQGDRKQKTGDRKQETE